jgi:two-component system, NarL family, sensor kinase
VNKLSIFQKLLLSHLFIGISTLLLITYLFYHSFKEALISRTVAQLTSINDLKQIYIQDYFEGMQQSTQLLARNLPVTDLLQNASERIDTSGRYADFILLQQEFAYQDLLLFDTTLHLVFHQAHSFSYPTQLSPEFEEFHRFLKESLSNPQLGEVKLGNENTFFSSAQVKDARGTIIGVLLARLPGSPMEYVLNLRNGIGNTGESYVVGADFRMRSHSRFFPEKIPQSIEVHTGAVRNALQDSVGPFLMEDYRGVQVISAYHRLNIPGLKWAIVSEIDLEEAMQPVYQMRSSMFLIGVGVCFLITLLTWFVSLPLSQRIDGLKEIVLQLSKGKLPAKALYTNTYDEIGQMIQATNQLILGLRRTSLFASEIGNGQLQSSYEPLSQEDSLGIALTQMRDKLKASQEKEILLSRQRTTALLEGEENERRRISRELHDGIGQLLTAIQFKINSIEGQEPVRREIKAILDETILEVRRISHNLMPNVLRDFGLEAALRSLCNRTAQATGWQVNYNFDADPEAPALSQEFITSLYRIAQEGINNAVKHAQATKLDVVVDHEPDQVQLRIRDNGKGFDFQTYDDQNGDGNGIRNMRERTHLLGGNFQIISRVGEGTTLSLTVPLGEKLQNV